jgi:hypothetical protein
VPIIDIASQDSQDGWRRTRTSRCIALRPPAGCIVSNTIDDVIQSLRPENWKLRVKIEEGKMSDEANEQDFEQFEPVREELRKQRRLKR